MHTHTQHGETATCFRLVHTVRNYSLARSFVRFYIVRRSSNLKPLSSVSRFELYLRDAPTEIWKIVVGICRVGAIVVSVGLNFSDDTPPPTGGAKS